MVRRTASIKILEADRDRKLGWGSSIMELEIYRLSTGAGRCQKGSPVRSKA
jgi:hypothetical protein